MEFYQIAQVQLHKAIELYRDGDYNGDYICAITLAGAAEETLGKLIKHCKGDDQGHILDEMVNKIISEHDGLSKKEIIDVLNNARNGLKHFNSSKEFEFKPVDDSTLLILRAILNYQRLREAVTKEMSTFIKDDQVNQVLEHILSSRA